MWKDAAAWKPNFMEIPVLKKQLKKLFNKIMMF